MKFQSSILTIITSDPLNKIPLSQNNEKVVLVVARRKGNYASSQSTAITGQRDETDGAVPGPQSSGKVAPVLHKGKNNKNAKNKDKG